MRIEKHRLVWTGVRGRNGADSPISLADDECVEAINVDFWDGSLCRKRRGAIALSLTSGPNANVESLIVHTPAGGYPQIMAYGNASAFYRLSDSVNVYSWSTPSMADAGTNTVATGATLNNKCFLAYDSAVNRLHVWDGTSIRRVGLAVPPVVTVTNTGSGSYPATIRYYRTAWAHISGSTTIRRSELCATATPFTPDGSSTHAHITRGTAPSEGETHWLLYAAAEDVYSSYKLIATTAIATTTFDDNTAPSAYTGDAPQIAGLNIPPPSAKYIISDGNRLLMAGAYESSASAGQTTPREGTVWYTRVLGTSDIGDDETIPETSATGTIPAQKNRIQVGQDNGDAITGLGVVGGTIFVFKKRQFWRLDRTGDDLAPYRAVLVSPSIGCVAEPTIRAGEGPNKEPVLFFCAESGMHYVTMDSTIEYIGRGIEDKWLASLILNAYQNWCVYHRTKRQLWFGIGLVSSLPAQPYHIGVYDLRTQGWTLHTTTNVTWNCATMFPGLDSGMGSTPVQPERPIIGGDAVLYQFDDNTVTTDGGTTFQAYIQSRPYYPAGIGANAVLQDSRLLGEAASGVTITATLTRDFGLETKTATALLTAAASETRVSRRLEESAFAGVEAVQYTVGDASAISNAWILDAVTTPTTPQESLS